MNVSVKTCLTCGKTLKGRSDKKFCDDYCRNAYNNRLKADDNNYIRKIINNLRRNRRILEELLPAHEKMSKASRDKLLQMGFQFKYFTHTYANQKGDIYYFCFDHGYLPLEHGWYLLVRKKEI